MLAAAPNLDRSRRKVVPRTGFWPWFRSFGLRFLIRHPTKLRKFWLDAAGVWFRERRLAELAGVPLSDIRRYLRELEEHPSYGEVFELFGGYRGYRDMDPTYAPVYYVLCRALKPSKVVETGVLWGLSSRFILLALELNGHGELYSIDLPQDYVTEKGRPISHKFPEGKTTGWLVPDEWKHRWRLLLGDSKKLLPETIQNVAPIDIFIHDSVHTYEFMMFEYTTAWPGIRPGGLLLSDDTGWNPAFREFSASVAAKPVVFGSGVGGLRKP